MRISPQKCKWYWLKARGRGALTLKGGYVECPWGQNWVVDPPPTGDALRREVTRWYQPVQERLRSSFSFFSDSPIPLSRSLYLCPPPPLSLSLSVSLSYVSLSLSVCLSHSACLSLCLSVCLSLGCSALTTLQEKNAVSDDRRETK